MQQSTEDENSTSRLELELASCKSQLKSLQEERQLLREEVNELRARLSKLLYIESTIKVDGAENLTDPDRPSNLVRQYKELFDNEWSVADEYLSYQIPSLPRRCFILRNILTTKSCSYQKFGTTIPVAPVLLSAIQDFLRTNARQWNITSVEKSVCCYVIGLNQPTIRYDKEQYRQKIVPYVKKCARLAWLMRVQTPPMHIAYRDERFKERHHHRMTGKGEYIEAVVWPRLYKYQQRMIDDEPPEVKGYVILTSDPSKREKPVLVTSL